MYLTSFQSSSEVDDTSSHHNNIEDTIPSSSAPQHHPSDFERETIDNFDEEESLEELDDETLERIEQEAGLVEESSVIDQYLKSIQDRIKEDNKKYPPRYPRPPREYLNGTFWVHRKNPVFALGDQINFSPDVLYQPRVFLWFPHHLVSNLTCPRCSTPTTFNVKEWKTAPRARRITDLDE